MSMYYSDDQDELIAIITKESAKAEHFIGQLLAEDMADAIIDAGFKKGTRQ